MSNKILRRFRLSPLPQPEDQIDDESDEGDRGDEDPDRLLFDGPEVPSGRVEDGPQGYEYKRDADADYDFYCGKIH